MSRLIVKGLPQRYKNDDLRSLFAKVGQVTDARVMKAPSGRSRMFGYVGFRGVSEAKRAISTFNKTYVGASRISVDLAKDIGDQSIPRPWSQYSKGSSRFSKRQGPLEDEGARKRALEGRPSSRKKRKVQSDNTAVEGRPGSATHNRNAASIRNFRKGTSETGERLTEKYNVALQKPQLHSRGAEGKEPTKQKNATSSTLSDAEYLKSKMQQTLLDESEEEEEEEEEEEGKERGRMEKGKEMEDCIEQNAAGGSQISCVEDEGESEPSHSDVGDTGINLNDEISANSLSKKEVNNTDSVDVTETGRLFVRNLAYSVTEEELEELFERFGKLADVHLVTDSLTKKSRGIAFVLYVVPENAAKAMAALDGKAFAGRLLHILPGRNRPDQVTAERTQEFSKGTEFQRNRESLRKDAAVSKADSKIHNSLFMSSDAVASVFSERFGVSKSTLYGTAEGESGSAAVRIAAGEAQLQVETRAFFSAEGIELPQKSKDQHATKSSRTAFLIKNLPAGTKRRDLEEKFNEFGNLKRLLVAPSGLLAVAEYTEGGSAKRAYGATAYTRLKDSPIYLEWLPAASLVPPSDKHTEQGNEESTPAHGEVDETGSTSEAANSSVFVKNLNFDTTEASLRGALRKALSKKPKVFAAIRSVSIATRQDPKNPKGERLSNGYAFLEFSSPEYAADVIRLAQGIDVDGFKIELRRSLSNKGGERRTGLRKARKLRAPSSKIVVKNIAFEATAKDIRALFATFGQMKSVRMPRKFDGSNRGFAFVEFVSKNEAVGALTALKDAHLYGRHLVLDFAEKSDGSGPVSMKEMMEKAHRQIRSSTKKLDIEAEEDTEALDEEKIRDELYS